MFQTTNQNRLLDDRNPQYIKGSIIPEFIINKTRGAGPIPMLRLAPHKWSHLATPSCPCHSSTKATKASRTQRGEWKTSGLKDVEIELSEVIGLPPAIIHLIF